MSIQYKYNLTGAERKAFVQAVSGILGESAVYQKAPSFAYTIGSYSVDKNGTLFGSGSVNDEEAEGLVSRLKEYGYVPEEQAGEGPLQTTSDANTLVIEIPKSGFDEAARVNLEKIIASKNTLLKKVLDAEELRLVVTESTIQFPWFTLHGIEGEVDAYNRLVAALCKMAKEQKRVTAKERDVQNEKFVMRLFLIRLGFIGDEYKSARKILLRSLTGNGSWKDGHRPEQPVSENSSQGGILHEK